MFDEESLMNRINDIKDKLKGLKNKDYFFTLCRHENYIPSDRIEEYIDDNLNDTFKKIAIAYYEKELDNTKSQLKEVL